MRLFILFFSLCYSSYNAAAQADFISVKRRNGITIESFYEGKEIAFITKSNISYNGIVYKIKNDSLYFKIYHTEKYPTNWGTYFIDTTNSYVIPVHYKSIKTIQLNKQKRGARYFRTLGSLMFTGGAGYDILNVANSFYLKYSLTDKQNLTNLAIASGVALTGLAVKKTLGRGDFNHKRYRIVYVKM